MQCRVPSKKRRGQTRSTTVPHTIACRIACRRCPLQRLLGIHSCSNGDRCEWSANDGKMPCKRCFYEEYIDKCKRGCSNQACSHYTNPSHETVSFIKDPHRGKQRDLGVSYEKPTSASGGSRERGAKKAVHICPFGKFGFSDIFCLFHQLIPYT